MRNTIIVKACVIVALCFLGAFVGIRQGAANADTAKNACCDESTCDDQPDQPSSFCTNNGTCTFTDSSDEAIYICAVLTGFSCVTQSPTQNYTCNGLCVGQLRGCAILLPYCIDGYCP